MAFWKTVLAVVIGIALAEVLIFAGKMLLLGVIASQTL